MSILRVEQDGVEFFTIIATGVSGMSEIGLSRLAGVRQQSINDLIKSISTGSSEAKCFKPFLGSSFILQARVKKNGRSVLVNVVPSHICAAIINYYAYISEAQNEIAYYSSLKFAEMGIEAWIQKITGWTPAMANPQTASEPTFESVEKFINYRLAKGLIATAVHPELVIEMLQDCGFSAAAYRLYFYLEMRALQNQHPEVETICQELNISRTTFRKWLPQIHEWTHCADWLEIVSRRKGTEFEIQKRLHQELGGKMEAYTPVGPIDLITKTEAIEIKRIEDWKEALGQVIAKAQSFPKLTKRIHLFGESSKQLKKITHNCQPLDVLVTFEKIQKKVFERLHKPRNPNM
jgi:hypothetical protein